MRALLIFLLVSPCLGVEVSLYDVWTLNMPDTKSMRELEPEIGPEFPSQELRERSRIFQLTTLVAKKKDAAKGFVVKGDGQEALRRATESLKSNQWGTTFLAEDQLTLVFFSKSSSKLASVKIDGENISVRYKSTNREGVSAALIPLGKLPIGKKRITIFLVDRHRELVTDSFRFQVR